MNGLMEIKYLVCIKCPNNCWLVVMDADAGSVLAAGVVTSRNNGQSAVLTFPPRLHQLQL